jgi:hypothetical protein
MVFGSEVPLRARGNNRRNFRSTTLVVVAGADRPRTPRQSVWTIYDGLIPVPPHLWHLTILSPFLSVPFPSQFLHGFFFSPMLFFMASSENSDGAWRSLRERTSRARKRSPDRAKRNPGTTPLRLLSAKRVCGGQRISNHSPEVPTVPRRISGPPATIWPVAP